jgi:RNA polymerase sigma-70 factor, ECF subfamily
LKDDEIDLQLIQRLADHDATAIEELYDRHASLLFALILRIVGDRSEAEDVLQDVLLRVWQRADTYDRLFGVPRAWLVRIARNRAIDALRAKRRDPADVLEAAEQPSLSSPADESTMASEERSAVAGALAALDPAQRQLIESAFFQGYSQSELATRFNLPLGTVKTRIRRGMTVLRGTLAHIYEA